MLSLLIWWLILQGIGLLALPIALRLLRFLPDRGYGFARPLGLLLGGYLFWLLTILGLLQNTTAGILFSLLIVGALSVYLWTREGPAMWAALRERRRIVVATEVIFAVALAAFALFRAYNPDIAATEKPMEFGFINAILRSRTFPPSDPWLSGFSISYYYFGYVIAAMLTKLSGLPSDITFNLMGTTLFALTVGGAFSLVYNLVQATLDRRTVLAEAAQKVRRELVSWAGILTGLLGAVLVALMGNLEGVFELIRARGGGSEALWRWLDVYNLSASAPSAAWYPTDTWWWWRASRVLQDRDALGNHIEIIDEFPFFSFLLGDNHPHVLALPFVLLALALGLNLLLSRGQEDADGPAPWRGSGWFARVMSRIAGLWAGGPAELALWALLLGGLAFLNTWDYPVYLGILLLCYALQRQSTYEHTGLAWLGDVVQMGLLLFLLGVVLYLPFYLGFRSQAGGLGLVTAKTNLQNYLLMFGVAIYLTASLLLALFLACRRYPAAGRKLPRAALSVGVVALLGLVLSVSRGWWTAALGLALAGAAAVLLLWGGDFVPQKEGGREARLEPSVLFVLLLATAGIALTLSCEFIFLRDTFDNRMNTVFKFYYQSWVLLGIASAYGVFYVVRAFRTVSMPGRIGLGVWALAGILLVGAGLSYTAAATVSKANDFQGQPTLDGTRYIAQYRQDDYDAVQWLRSHALPGTVMLEATGGSYSEYDWISAHTGIPTVLGWGGHELQWRGNYDEPARREPDIAAIYQGMDPSKVAALLDKYDITYVYVGRLEREKYRLSAPMVDKFDQLMVRAYENEGVIVYSRVR